MYCECQAKKFERQCRLCLSIEQKSIECKCNKVFCPICYQKHECFKYNKYATANNQYTDKTVNEYNIIYNAGLLKDSDRSTYTSYDPTEVKTAVDPVREEINRAIDNIQEKHGVQLNSWLNYHVGQVYSVEYLNRILFLMKRILEMEISYDGKFRTVDKDYVICLSSTMQRTFVMMYKKDYHEICSKCHKCHVDIMKIRFKILNDGTIVNMLSRRFNSIDDLRQSLL